ncbi:hypothetical protein [Vibrio alginolyticus]
MSDILKATGLCLVSGFIGFFGFGVMREIQHGDFLVMLAGLL